MLSPTTPAADPSSVLIAATLTPFHPDGRLCLEGVEQQAAHLQAGGVRRVFIGGTTGECSSLTLDERLSLAQRWFEVTRGIELKIIVHVGSNCLADARIMAAQAEQLGATAISALSPSYFKPATIEALTACCADIAAAAPATPFYFYDIPSLTGVNLSMPDFLQRAGEQIPTFAGLKFTNLDLISLQRCLRAAAGRWEILWGTDELLLPACALGAKGAVGSTYNYAAALHGRLLKAFWRGDLEAARVEQFRCVELVRVLCRRGYLGSAKALMGMLGVQLGPMRLPNATLTGEHVTELRRELEEMGAFGWLKT